MKTTFKITGRAEVSVVSRHYTQYFDDKINYENSFKRSVVYDNASRPIEKLVKCLTNIHDTRI